MTETLAVSAGSAEFGLGLEAEPTTIRRVIDLTAVGELIWSNHLNEFGNPIFISEVDYLDDKTISAKLDLARVVIEYDARGYTSTRFVRLLMTSTRETITIVDGSSDTDADRVSTANMLFRIVESAVSTDEGLLEGTMTDCSNCGRETGHCFQPASRVMAADLCLGGLRCIHCYSAVNVGKGLQKRRI